MYISIGMYMLYMYIQVCKKKKKKMSMYVPGWMRMYVHTCASVCICVHTHINKYMMDSPAKGQHMRFRQLQTNYLYAYDGHDF